MKTIAILTLSLLALAPAAAAKKLSTAETQELLQRARERLLSPAEPAAPFLVQAKVRLLFEENAPTGLYQYSEADAHRWRREISLPGWREAKGRDGERVWSWRHEQNHDALSPLARWLVEALEPACRLVARDDARAVPRLLGDEEVLEIEGIAGSTIRIDPDSGLPRSLGGGGGPEFHFAGWVERGGRAWPLRASISKDGQPLLLTELSEAAADFEELPDEHYAAPEGAAFGVRDGMPGLVAPRLLNEPRPEYPRELLRRGEGGTVILRCVIGVDGLARDVEVLESTHPALADSARRAVEGRRYSPGLLQGRPVEVISTIRIGYSTSPPPGAPRP